MKFFEQVTAFSSHPKLVNFESVFDIFNLKFSLSTFNQLGISSKFLPSSFDNLKSNEFAY